MKQDKINHQLIDEYGLNESNFKLLCLARKSDIQWNGPGLSAISLQPANALRKLVDRGLLDGPTRKQKISARPFALTEAGREVLAKIERGLHRNGWMSAGKVKVLELLELTGGGPARPQSLWPMAHTKRASCLSGMLSTSNYPPHTLVSQSIALPTWAARR